MTPIVESFFDSGTSTFTHVVFDGEGGHAVVIDPVLNYDAATARTSTASADRLLEFLDARRLNLQWILETHAHADHLTAAAYLRERTGAPIAIGYGITRVQEKFKDLFGLESSFVSDGSQFDRLLADGEELCVGALRVRILATPGHTEDGLSYVCGDAVFVGDTIFAPDSGTARTDFPGGSAERLLHSIELLFALPGSMRVFLCHDYPPAGRLPQACFMLEEQRRDNIHVGERVRTNFVAVRVARDATLPAPALILPSLQVNIRAGELPPPSEDGVRYLRLPLNRFGHEP